MAAALSDPAHPVIRVARQPGRRPGPWEGRRLSCWTIVDRGLADELFPAEGWIWQGAPDDLFRNGRFDGLYRQIIRDKTLIIDAAAGREDAIGHDIRLGANVNVVPAWEDWRPPIDWAVQCHRDGSVRLLLHLGADPNLKAYQVIPPGVPFGFTPLMAAVEADDIPAIRLLLAHGAHPNAQASNMVFARPSPIRGHSATTALNLAAGNPDEVGMLLRAGARPDAPKQDGRTALLWAAAYGRERSIHLPLRAGADICRADDAHARADAIARANGHLVLADRLARLQAPCPTRGNR